MKRTLLCALCGLIACLAMSACAGPTPPGEPCGIIEPTQALYDGLDLLKPHAAQTADAEGKTEYCIVIDDGSGMKGFVSEYCFSYGAVLTAVMDVSIGGQRTYFRASELDGAQGGANAAAESFLNEATQVEFFRDESNDVSNVIEAMASLYQRDGNQVMILVSGLMIPTEDGCMSAAAAIRNAFLLPENATVGIIGMVGDFRGTIENLPVNPRTGSARKISDYMVQQRDENGVFRHPLYILFMGDDRAVLSAMEKAMTGLKASGLRDGSNPVYALYFSEYGVSRREEDNVELEFHMGHDEYDIAGYDVQYIVRGVADENGTVEYPSTKAVPAEYQQLLKNIQIVKLYSMKRGNVEKNVTLYGTIPFTLTDSSVKGEPIVDRHGLLVPVKELSLSDKDYSVSVDIRVLEYDQKAGAQPAAKWTAADQSLVKCESQILNVQKGTIELKLTVNSKLIQQDEPLLVAIDVSVRIDPKWEEIEALYDTDWIGGLTLNQKEFEREANRQDTSSSARYTYATTAKTPFLSSLFESGICDQQIEITLNAIGEKTEACVQTAMFGVVVRTYPAVYVKGDWSNTENFGGWAFSYEEALGITRELASGH